MAAETHSSCIGGHTVAAKTHSSCKKVRGQRHIGKKEKAPLGGGPDYWNLKPKKPA